jgi:hypothetical protein
MTAIIIMPTGIALAMERTGRPVRAVDIRGLSFECSLEVFQMQVEFRINHFNSFDGRARLPIFLRAYRGIPGVESG